MTDSFLLSLDTTPPVVTWGPVDGAVMSEELTVQYLLDEPELLSAEIELADNRVLPMTDDGPQLRVLLPDDAPDGTAVIRAHVRDDVLNTNTWALVVSISGVPPVVPERTYGFPGAKPPPVAVSFEHSRARASSTYRQTAVVRSTSRARATSAYAISRSIGSADLVTWRSGLTISSTYRTSAFVRSRTTAVASQVTAVHKRPEGPDADDELILFGLI